MVGAYGRLGVSNHRNVGMRIEDAQNKSLAIRARGWGAREVQMSFDGRERVHDKFRHACAIRGGEVDVRWSQEQEDGSLNSWIPQQSYVQGVAQTCNKCTDMCRRHD